MNSTDKDVIKLLNIQCRPENKSPIGVRCIDVNTRKPSANYCRPDTNGINDIMCLQMSKPIGNANINIYFGILDGKVGLIFFSFLSEDYTTIKFAFENKYGKPDGIEKEILKTRMGAKYENELLTWFFDDGNLTLTKYENKISKGGGKIRSNRWMNTARQRHKAQITSNAGDL